MVKTFQVIIGPIQCRDNNCTGLFRADKFAKAVDFLTNKPGGREFNIVLTLYNLIWGNDEHGKKPQVFHVKTS
jgi:hypothetical protein